MDNGNADAFSHLPAGDDRFFDREEEEDKRSMVLTICVVDKQ